MGNLGSFAFTDSLSAGASTAIFGLFGAFMMLEKVFPKNPAIVSMAKTFLLFIVLNIGTDIFVSGIDIAGHLGGTGWWIPCGVCDGRRFFQDQPNQTNYFGNYAGCNRFRFVYNRYAGKILNFVKMKRNLHEDVR